MAWITRQRLVRLIAPLDERDLDLWISERWVDPSPDGAGGDRFTEVDVARAMMIRDLRHDLDVPDDAIAIVLDLLDQLSGARSQLESLMEAVARQDRETRRKIAEICRLRLDQ